MSVPEQISEQVLDEATDWLVVLHSGEVTEQQIQQFEQWRTEKKQHAEAIQYIEKFTSSLTNLPESFQSNKILNSNKSFNGLLKKNTLLSLAGMLSICLACYMLPWHKWQSDYRTGTGEIKTIALQDGSKLTLASNSYVNIKFSSTIRAVELIEGEIYIETAKDQHKRPFMVETQFANLQALGTQFSVRQEDRHKVKLNVYQHAVAIRPYNAAHKEIIYEGSRAVFNDSHISEPIPLKNEKPYWTQYLLVVDNWPLKKVLHEIYRYQNGTFILDKSIENIPVSGVFSLANSSQSLETLAFTHQLQLRYYSPYMVKISKN